MPHRKISRCPQEFIDIIYQVANRLNVTDTQYTTAFGCDDDVDSVLCDTYKVTIKGHKDGQAVQYGFIIKWVSDAKKRKSLRNLYHRDYAFHFYVVPKLIEVQNNFKVIEGLKTAFTNCVYASMEENKETLVFTLLFQHGYELYNRLNKMDLAHCNIVIKTLAKLHALFFVFQYINLNDGEIIKMLYQKDVQYGDPTSIPASIIHFYKDAVNVVRDQGAKEKLQEHTTNIFSILHKCTNSHTHYSTICHGDCWNNNILFKYQGERPVDGILIDYQVSRYASPVTDLSYFLYMTADEIFLDNHYEKLIDLYYKTLGAVIRQCNLDVEEIYPTQIFEKHLKEYSVLGLIESLISMKIITAVSEEAIEMAEMRYEIKEKVSCDSQSQNQSLFVDRVNGVVNHFFKRGYSLDEVLIE